MGDEDKADAAATNPAGASPLDAVAEQLQDLTLVQQTMAEEHVGTCDGHEPPSEDDSGSSSESDPGWAMVQERMAYLRTVDSAPPHREPVLSSFDIDGIAEYVTSRGVRNVICMVGAGISVAAGIPDFRSPGTGLYANLRRYRLPHPEAVFELSYFRKRPEPFYMLAKELMPGRFRPTKAHHFIRLLHDRGLLRRCYTQNIDSLETAAGLPPDAVVAAHGNFDSAACIDCRAAVDTTIVAEAIREGQVCRCPRCSGLVKPNIVFFGESLPERFFRLSRADFGRCDLLIIMGTSLSVHPFASLIDAVGTHVPRLLINREEAGVMAEELFARGCERGLWFGHGAWRDAKHLGECDEGVAALADRLGWDDALQALLDA